MSREKITFNDAGVALLGNAMLLSCQSKPVGLSVSSSGRRDHRSARSNQVDAKELRYALFAAGMLDTRLAQALDLSQDQLGEKAQNARHRLDALADGEGDIAAVRFDDFRFPVAVSERYQIAEALAAAGEIELQTPIARLQPSELFERVRRLVVDYAKDCAALNLGVSRAEAVFIGLDGLVTRRELTQRTNWLRWNSAAARRARKETGWLQDLLEKARRHVLRPVELAYGDSSTNHDLAALGLTLEKLGPSFRSGEFSVHSDLNALASHLCHGPAVSQEVLEQLFPSYGAMLDQRDDRVDADPFNVLAYMSAQVAWHTVRQGWALCIAEDGLDGGCFSWVPPEAFPRMSDTTDFPLPEEIGIRGCFDLDARAKTALGTERLWFVLAKDAASALDVAAQSEYEDPEDSKPKREYNRGFTVADAPYVAEGLQMLQTGEAKSALNAAQILISKHGEITEADWSSGSTGIRSYTLGGAERRLQKAISKEWKKRSK